MKLAHVDRLGVATAGRRRDGQRAVLDDGHLANRARDGDVPLALRSVGLVVGIEDLNRLDGRLLGLAVGLGSRREVIRDLKRLRTEDVTLHDNGPRHPAFDGSGRSAFLFDRRSGSPRRRTDLDLVSQCFGDRKPERVDPGVLDDVVECRRDLNLPLFDIRLRPDEGGQSSRFPHRADGNLHRSPVVEPRRNEPRAGDGLGLRSGIGLHGHQLFGIGDDIEGFRRVDLHLAVLDLDTNRFE